MRRPPALILSLMLLACDGQPSTCPEPAPAPTSTQARADAAVLAPAVMQVARSGAKVQELELRLDAGGALVKQAAYHDDAAAIPESVRALVEQSFPAATATHYETEHYADRGDLYEVEVTTADGQQCEVAGTADGELVYTECRIDPATLPEPVTARVTATFAGAKIVEAERKQSTASNEPEQFSVEVEHQGREYYLYIAVDGTLLSKYLRIPALVEVPID